jgi:hypothetical protein
MARDPGLGEIAARSRISRRVGESKDIEDVLPATLARQPVWDMLGCTYA